MCPRMQSLPDCWHCSNCGLHQHTLPEQKSTLSEHVECKKAFAADDILLHFFTIRLSP